jgi:hypothetical protein
MVADEYHSTRSLIDKLGVKPASRVSILGIDDAYFLSALQARTPDVSRRPRKDSDMIFFAADSQAALKRLETLKKHIQKDGVIWVVSLKGRQATIRDVQVIAAAKAAGLVDNKVVSFSDTHTALRLTIPLSKR